MESGEELGATKDIFLRLGRAAPLLSDGVPDIDTGKVYMLAGKRTWESLDSGPWGRQ